MRRGLFACLLKFFESGRREEGEKEGKKQWERGWGEGGVVLERNVNGH